MMTELIKILIAGLAFEHLRDYLLVSVEVAYDHAHIIGMDGSTLQRSNRHPLSVDVLLR